jgi:outer membrane protein assembly factor BamD
MKRIVALGLIFLLISLEGCVGATDPSSRYKDSSEKQLYQMAVFKMKRGNFKGAVNRLESLDARYPFGEYAKKAQFYSIYAFYKAGDMASSLAAADRYIHLYPTDSTVGYALYLRGVMNYKQHMNLFDRYLPSDLAQRDMLAAKHSFMDFKRLVHDFPKSKYVPNAEVYMAYLRNILAEHQLKIARFYYDRKAYVGALNRAGGVVKHYQGAPSVLKALVLMKNAYQELGLHKEAVDVARVYSENYLPALPSNKRKNKNRNSQLT